MPLGEAHLVIVQFYWVGLCGGGGGGGGGGEATLAPPTKAAGMELLQVTLYFGTKLGCVVVWPQLLAAKLLHCLFSLSCHYLVFTTWYLIERPLPINPLDTVRWFEVTPQENCSLFSSI